MDYYTYIKSPEWYDYRAKIASRFKHICQICLRPQGTGVVHHLTYIRLGAEWLIDCIYLCKSCHHYIHSSQEPRVQALQWLHLADQYKLPRNDIYEPIVAILKRTNPAGTDEITTTGASSTGATSTSSSDSCLKIHDPPCYFRVVVKSLAIKASRRVPKEIPLDPKNIEKILKVSCTQEQPEALDLKKLGFVQWSLLFDYSRGQSVDSIAKERNVSRRTVYNHLQAAFKLLR